MDELTMRLAIAFICNAIQPPESERKHEVIQSDIPTSHLNKMRAFLFLFSSYTMNSQ